MTSTELPVNTAEEVPAQLTTAEIRTEKRPSPAPEVGDEVPSSFKKQKKTGEEIEEPVKDGKADDVAIPLTPKKEAVLAEPLSPVVPATKLLIKKLSPKGRIPTRGSALAAGYDMYRYVFFLDPLGVGLFVVGADRWV